MMAKKLLTLGLAAFILATGIGFGKVSAAWSGYHNYYDRDYDYRPYYHPNYYTDNYYYPYYNPYYYANPYRYIMNYFDPYYYFHYFNPYNHWGYWHHDNDHDRR